MPGTLLAGGQPFRSPREYSHRSSAERIAADLQVFPSVGTDRATRSGAFAPMAYLHLPAAFAPANRKERISPAPGPSSCWVTGTEPLCRLAIPRESAQNQWSSGAVRDCVYSRACRNSHTEPPWTLDGVALQLGEPLPTRQDRSHAFERIPSWLRRNRAFGSRRASASLPQPILRGIDRTRSDGAIAQTILGRPRTNGMLGAFHEYGTMAPRLLAIGHRSINASLSSLGRHTLPLDAKLRPSESSDRPVEAGAFDA